MTSMSPLLKLKHKFKHHVEMKCVTCGFDDKLNHLTYLHLILAYI